MKTQRKSKSVDLDLFSWNQFFFSQAVDDWDQNETRRKNKSEDEDKIDKIDDDFKVNHDEDKMISKSDSDDKMWLTQNICFREKKSSEIKAQRWNSIRVWAGFFFSFSLFCMSARTKVFLLKHRVTMWSVFLQ